MGRRIFYQRITKRIGAFEIHNLAGSKLSLNKINKVIKMATNPGLLLQMMLIEARIATTFGWGIIL